MRRVSRTLVAVVAAVVVAVAAIAGAWSYRQAREARELFREAQAAARRQNFALAKQLCDRILAGRPDDFAALRLRSEVAMAEGDYPAAVALLSRMPDEPASTGAAARYYEGVALLEMGRAREAEQMFLRSLVLEPAAARPEAKLRELYLLQLRRDDLRALLLSRKQTGDWQLHDVLDFIVAGHVPRYIVGDCMTRVRLFVEHDDDDVASRLALASYCAATGELTEAAAIAGELLRRDPHNARAAALLVDAQLGQDQLAEAQATLRRFDASPSADAALWRSRGRVALAEGDHDRAGRCLRESLHLTPGDPAALYQLGLARAQGGSRTQADELTRRSRELSQLIDTARRILKLSEDPREHSRFEVEIVALGELMLECELFEDATYCFEFLLRRQSGNTRAQKLYAKAQAELRRSRASASPLAPNTPTEAN